MNSKAKIWGISLLAYLLITFLVGSANDLLAQGRVTDYTLTSIGTGFTSISGTATGSGDSYAASVSLPFNFNYDNKLYSAGSTIRFGTDGWLEFEGGQPAGSPYVDRVGNTSYNYKSTIYIWSHDQYVVTGMYYTTLGTAPNRIFVVEWVNLRGYNSGNQATMQVRLHESTYVIELHYKNPGMTMSKSSSMGLHGGASPSFVWKRFYGPSTAIPSTNYRLTPPIPPGHQLSVSPKTIDFGPLNAGEMSAEFDVTVRNAGITTNLIVNSASLAGHQDFTIVSSPPSNVYPPGASGTYKLRFAPQAAGARMADFTISSNGLDSGAQTVKLNGFGFVPQVEFEATSQLFRKTRTPLGKSLSYSTVIKSTGNGALAITGATITGEYAANYQITRMPAAVIPAGTHDTLTVTYFPKEEGLRIAQLVISTNALKDPNKTFTMYGLGIIPRLMITPRNVAFDSVGMGDTAYATVRLENSGSDTLAIHSNYLTFADPDFTYMGLEGSDSLIAPERFRDVQVRFIPQTRGHREARLRYLTNIPMTFEDVVRDTSEFTVDITGVAVPYGLLSIDAPQDIDSVVIGTELCRSITVWNNGESPLTVNSATITGPDAADFEIHGTIPFTIEPMGNVEMQICATPSTRGLRAAMVDVSATSGDKTTTTQLPLAIFGLAVCAQPDMTTAFAGEIVRVNTSQTATITVTNCGDVASDYTGVVAGAGYTLTGSATSGMIAPNGTATFTVEFKPTQRVLMPGTLTISAEGLTPIVVDLVGTGGNSVLAATNTNADPTALGEKSQFEVTVTNTGNMDWNIGTPTVAPGEFTLLNPIPTAIAAGSDQKFTFEFEPLLGSTRRAMVTFTSSDNPTFSFEVTGTVSSVRPTAARGYVLGQNYPNPVNATSTISFTMAEAGHARIVVSDLTGNVVAVLADGFYNGGANEVKFDVSNLASGSYFYELEANGVRLQRALVVSQ